MDPAGIQHSHSTGVRPSVLNVLKKIVNHFSPREKVGKPHFISILCSFFYFYKGLNIKTMKKLLSILTLSVLAEVCMFSQTTVLKPNTLFGTSQQVGLDYVLRVDPD